MKTQLLALTLAAIWALTLVVKHPDSDKPAIEIMDFFPTKAECKTGRKLLQKVITEQPHTAFSSCEEYQISRADLNPLD